MFSVRQQTTVELADDACELAHLWFVALSAIDARHPNGLSRTRLLISRDAVLRVEVDRILDTRDLATPMRSPFVISCVRLTFFPGEGAARAWFAAAWAGYVMHEALELVTVDSKAILDPHAEPYATNPANRCLRDGFPPALTPETMARAMRVVLGGGA